MPTNEQVIAWLDELCQEAKNDVSLLNHLSKNDAFPYYFNNVYTLKSITPKMFTETSAMVEARRWYVEYMEGEARKLAEAARDEKIAGLEGKVDKLTELLTQLVESKAEPTPAKKNGKKAAAVEADEETEA
jgi:hypothetical protein